MCMVSNIGGFGRGWMEPYVLPTQPPYVWPTSPVIPVTPTEKDFAEKYEEFRKKTEKPAPAFTQEMADALNKLIKDAKRYDNETGQPDCENDDKKRALQELADKLKVKISFE